MQEMWKIKLQHRKAALYIWDHPQYKCLCRHFRYKSKETVTKKKN